LCAAKCAGGNQNAGVFAGARRRKRASCSELTGLRMPSEIQRKRVRNHNVPEAQKRALMATIGKSQRIAPFAVGA